MKITMNCGGRIKKTNVIKNLFGHITQKVSDWIYVYQLHKQAKQVAKTYLKVMEKADFSDYKGLGITSDINQYKFVEYNYAQIIKRLILTSATIDVIVAELYKRGATIEKIKQLLSAMHSFSGINNSGLNVTNVSEEHAQLYSGAFDVIQSQKLNEFKQLDDALVPFPTVSTDSVTLENGDVIKL